VHDLVHQEATWTWNALVGTIRSRVIGLWFWERRSLPAGSRSTSSSRWEITRCAATGGIYLEEEETGHPQQIPLLALRQIDDEGRVWGEVWLSPSDLVQLIDDALNWAP
jgi:hypothetical protein